MGEVSEAYILGVREGRTYMRRFKPNEAEMREVLRNLEATLQGFRGGEVAEALRGERDFWRNQLKAAGGK